MSILYDFIRMVESGKNFNIDFENKTMKVEKTFLIKNGEFDSTKELMASANKLSNIDDVIKCIEDMYQFYKFSLPSERSDNKRRSYFKALSINELTDEQLMFAGRREVEQARLEGFILCAILSDKFKWDESKLGKWFWQSKKDPDLVILRNWIENK